MTDDAEITDVVRASTETKLAEFMVYVKKSEPFLKKMKNDLGIFLTKKQQVMQNYANSANMLTEYEENNVCYYTDRDPSKLVITSTDTGQNFSEDIRHTIESLRNPFTDLYHWVKGEMYDLEAFTHALNERNYVKAAIETLKKKIISAKADIENVKEGKKSIGTLFKNADDVGKMQNRLEGYERDLEAQEKLLDVLSLYLGQTILPQFKEEKLRLYSRIIQQFHVVEIGNGHQLASFWSKVLKHENVISAFHVPPP